MKKGFKLGLFSIVGLGLIGASLTSCGPKGSEETYDLIYRSWDLGTAQQNNAERQLAQAFEETHNVKVKIVENPGSGNNYWTNIQASVQNKIDNADVVECDYFWEYPEETIRSSGKTYKNRHDMLVNSRVVAWNKLIKRDVLINSKIKFPVGLRYEDVEFFYKLIPYINSISIVKKPFVHYVQRESSISNVQNEKTADIIKILNNVIDYYKEKNLFEEYKVDLEYIYSRYILCSSLLRMVMIEDKIKREKVINYAWDSLNKKFPNWKKNPYLKEKNQKNYYMLSITPQTLKIYSKLGRIRSIRKKIQEKFI